MKTESLNQRQRRLLRKYRKRMKQLQYRIEYQQYLLLQARLKAMERDYDDCPRKSMLPALSRLHRRMVDSRERLFPQADWIIPHGIENNDQTEMGESA